ncbi:PilL [Pseudomonas aeruginosa]|nr:PilL [Pseudomonas aeruginosa]
MTRQLTTLTLCLLLASCTTHKAEPARPAFDSSRNPDLLSPDLYPNGVQPEKEPVVRYGRYTLVSTQPDAGQRDLMAQIIDVTIPSSMNPSVKDAMQYVMSRSGYSLCPAEAGHVNILYTRPLPAAQYKLGPMTLRNTPPGPLRPCLAGEGRRGRAAGLLRAAPGLSTSPGAKAETGPATVCEARCPNSSGGNATLLHGKSQHAGVARRGRLGANAGADHNQPRSDQEA